MSNETLHTAARRIVRFIRGDDHAHGGLLSVQTIKANEILARQVEDHEKLVEYVRLSQVTDLAPISGEWFARFGDSIEAVSVGTTRPNFAVGDTVTITIRRR